MSEIKKFEQQRDENIKNIGASNDLRDLGIKFVEESSKKNYSYNFSWMGRPVIQFPQDMIAMQEILWEVQPDLIIETGIAHGGSLVYYASLMELIGKGEVLGIDIDIREHNREAIKNHPMYKRISMIEGSAIDQGIVDQVAAHAEGKETVLVVLDSNHTHEHVAEELRMYSPFVTPNSYLVVFDTIVEDLPDDFFPNRPWGKGDNPKTAVWDFLKANDAFEIDHHVNDKLLVTVAPDGYLKRVK